jgi:hypothetical protein
MPKSGQVLVGVDIELPCSWAILAYDLTDALVDKMQSMFF